MEPLPFFSSELLANLTKTTTLADHSAAHNLFIDRPFYLCQILSSFFLNFKAFGVLKCGIPPSSTLPRGLYSARVSVAAKD